MELSEAEKNEIYKLFEMLGIDKGVDLRADAALAVQKYAEMITLINQGISEMGSMARGALEVAGATISPINNAPQQYTPEFGQTLISSTAELANVVSTLNTFMTANTLKEKLTEANMPQSFIDDPNLLIAELNKTTNIVAKLDEEYNTTWKNQVEDPVVNTATTAAENKMSLTERVDAQQQFYQYKQEIYPKLQSEDGQVVGTQAPDAQEIDAQYDIYNYGYILDLTKEAQALFSELPMGRSAKRLFDDEMLDNLAYPQTDEPSALDAWHKNALGFLNKLNEPDVHKTLYEAKSTTTYMNGEPWTNYEHLSGDERTRLDNLMNGAEIALAVDENLQNKIVGPYAAALTAEEQQILLGNNFLRPGQSYTFNVNPQTGQISADQDVEALKSVIGDSSEAGSLGENFQTQLDDTKTQGVKLAEEYLRDLEGYFEGGSRTSIQASLQDIIKQYGDYTFVGPTLDTTPMSDIFAMEAQKSEQQIWNELNILTQNLEHEMNSNPDLTSGEKVAISSKLSVLKSLSFELEKVAIGEAKLVDPATLSQPSNAVGNRPSAGRVGVNNNDANNSNNPVVQTDLEKASQAVEGFLMSLAPVLKENGLEDKIKLPTSADGEFDEVSQTALQGIFLCLDGMGVDGMGPNPWLYTAEKATTMAAGIKDNPEIMAQIMNQQAGDAIFKAENDKLVFAKEQTNGDVTYNIGDEVPQSERILADAYIDGLIANLNTLNTNGKLAKENKIGANSIIELSMGGMAQPLMWLINFLADIWPQAIPFLADVVSFFTNGRVDLYEVMDQMPEEFAQGNEAIATVRDALGLHGSDAPDLMTRMKENFKTAMTATNDDGSAVTLEQMKEKVVEMMKGIPPEIVDEAKYSLFVEQAFEQAQEALGDPEDPDYDAASDVFASLVAQEQASMIEEYIQSQGGVEAIDGRLAGIDMTPRELQEKRTVERMQHSSAIGHPLFYNEGSQVFLVFYDAKHEFKMDELKQEKDAYYQSYIKPYQDEVEGAQAIIRRVEERLSRPDDYTAADIEKFKEELNYREGELALAQQNLALNRLKYNEMVADYNRMAAEPIYKKVDVADEIAHLRSGGNMNPEDTPYLSGLGAQAQYNPYYRGWHREEMVRNTLKISSNTTTRPSNELNNRDNRNEFNEASRFLEKWEKMEAKEDAGRNMDGRRARLLKQYAEDLSDNKYLLREENRNEFQDNGTEVTGNDGSHIDFKISDPTLENRL